MNRRDLMIALLAGGLTSSAIAQQPSPAAAGSSGDETKEPFDAYVSFSLAINDNTIRSLVHAVNTVRNYAPRYIYLLIDSSGGSIESAVDFYNYATSLNRPIYTINMSRVSSAANYLFLAGSRRYAYPASYFMLHPGKSTATLQGVTQQSFDDLKTSLATSERLLRNILQQRAKFSEEEIERIFKSEVYYSPDQARKLGLVNTLDRPLIRDNDMFIICTETEGGYWKDFQ